MPQRRGWQGSGAGRCERREHDTQSKFDELNDKYKAAEKLAADTKKQLDGLKAAGDPAELVKELEAARKAAKEQTEAHEKAMAALELDYAVRAAIPDAQDAALVASLVDKTGLKLKDGAVEGLTSSSRACGRRSPFSSRRRNLRRAASRAHARATPAEQAAALEEVVANAIPAVFAQQETVERIARTDTSLARRIADFFRRLADKLRGLLDGLTRSQRKFAAAQELAQMEEQIGEIADRFFEVLGDTSANAERRTEQDARGVRRLSRRSPEALSIKEQIALRQDDLNGMEPVIEIQSEVRPRRNGKPDRTLVRKALQNYYGSLKYSVERRGFGTVQFDEMRSVRCAIILIVTLNLRLRRLLQR